MTTKKPSKVTNCITHHYACECREWQFNKMKEALQKILLLPKWKAHDTSHITSLNASHVLEICKEGLDTK